MNEQLAILHTYLHGMWRYRWSALLISWIVAIFGWLFVLALPDQYTVKTVVYVDTSSVLRPLLKGLAPETSSEDELQIMSRVLLSRDNLLSAIRETDMDLDANTIEEKEKLLERLTNDIKIIGGNNAKKSDAKNNIYEISYSAYSANMAYKMVSSLLNTMIEDTLKSTRTDTESAQKFLDSQISLYEEKLSLSEKKLAKFKKENLGLMPDERGGYYQRLQHAQDTVEETSAALNLANHRYSGLLNQLENEQQLVSREHYQSENEKKIKEYQAQVNSLLTQYTDRHPKVRELTTIIENLKKAPGAKDDVPHSDVDKELNPVYQELKVELNKTKVEIDTLKLQLNEQENYVKKLNSFIDIMPEVEAKLAQLNRDYDVTKTRYLELVDRRESAKLAQSAGHNASNVNFRVIEPPIVPFIPTGPNRALFSVGVLFASFGAGLSWGLFRYFLEPTFTSYTQLASTIGFPVLGSVNLYVSPELRKRRRLQVSFFMSVTFFLVFTFVIVFFLRDWGHALLIDSGIVKFMSLIMKNKA